MGKYNELLQLRADFNKNEKAKKYYQELKEKNKNDIMYGWLFENDAILTDTIEDLDIFEKNYRNDIINTYISELHYIIEKAR